METLPPEMVEKITQYLTLQDLVRCCTVCRDWRNIFNEDHYWRRHQDLLLEEHLRTTPCSVEPAFEPPEAKNSTLTPISDARLFFLKEKHLWNNWKQQRYEEEKILPLNKEIYRSFLTNNCLIRWCSDSIEICDVRVIPMTPLVKTDPSVDIGGFLYFAVVSNDILLVQQVGCVKVFYVDLLRKKIELKHSIAFDEAEKIQLEHSLAFDEIEKIYLEHSVTFHKEVDSTVDMIYFQELNVVKGNIYIHVNSNRSFLEIIDIGNGEMLKKESCPVPEEDVTSAEIAGIKSSPTSDKLIVLIEAKYSSVEIVYHVYLYSLSQLTFLPDPVHENCTFYCSVRFLAIQGDYLAFGDDCSIGIKNYQTLDIIFYRRCREYVCPHVFNDGFVFQAEIRDDYYDNYEGWFAMFSLKDQKLTKVCKLRNVSYSLLSIINDKLIRVVYECNVAGIWERSDKTLKKSDIPDVPGKADIFNQALTRGADEFPSWVLPTCVYHFW